MENAALSDRDIYDIGYADGVLARIFTEGNINWKGIESTWNNIEEHIGRRLSLREVVKYMDGHNDGSKPWKRTERKGTYHNGNSRQ